MLTWISEQAKWIVYIFIVFIVAGLLFMDMSSLNTNSRPDIGIVNGVKLSNEVFDMQYKRLQNQQNQNGSSLTSQQLTQMRSNLFSSMVQRVLLEDELENLELVASPIEMLEDLKQNPPAGVVNSPMFMGPDSAFAQKKWEAFLATDSIWDDPQMLQIEASLRDDKIPFKQLQLYVNANGHSSDLEAKFNIIRRDDKYKMLVASVSLESFPVDVNSIKEEEVQKYFEANKDSFLVKTDMVKLAYVSLPITPSIADDAATKEYSHLILHQIKDGADFAEIAAMNSDDVSSAKNGGSLGGMTPRGRWVPEFEKVAFELDSGEISEPIKSQFGYHIIKCNGKEIKDSVELVDVSHILLKVSPSPETVDSLLKIINFVKADVDTNEKSFVEAASSQSLKIDTSSFFGRGQSLGKIGYLGGLASYAFDEKKSNEESIASDVFQNDNFILVGIKIDSLKAGEASSVIYKPSIIKSIARQKQLVQANDYLKSIMPKLNGYQADSVDTAFVASIPKLKMSITPLTGTDSYIQGIGFANPQVGKVILGKEKVWSSVIEGDNVVASLKVVDHKPYSIATLEHTIPIEVKSQTIAAASSMMNNWMKSKLDNAEIIDNTGLYFRD